MSALKRLAQALGVTADELIFEESERGPDDEIRLQFAAVADFAPEEKKAAKDLLDALILKTPGPQMDRHRIRRAAKQRARH